MSKQYEQWAEEIAQSHWADGEATAEGLAANIANTIEAAVEAERERCAKLAADLIRPMLTQDTKHGAEAIAAAIRHTSPLEPRKEQP